LNFRSCLIDIVVCLHCCSHIIRQHQLSIEMMLLTGFGTSLYYFCFWSQDATVLCMCTLYGA
jgi:hypothetical protein